MTQTLSLRRFENRVAIVAGGATGIGAATAQRLAAEGASVVIGDVAVEIAGETARAIEREGGRALAFRCDIGKEDEVRSLIACAVETFGGLDAIHINAADVGIVSRDTDATDVPLEVFDRTIEINLRGHLLCTRHAVPALLNRGGGSIVYTSSRVAMAPGPKLVSYAVSKSGIHALMRHTAFTWGKQGIRANVVAPGTVLTASLLKLGQAFVEERLRAVPGPRLGRAEDIAAGVAFLLSSDAEFVNGHVLCIDGGITMR